MRHQFSLQIGPVGFRLGSAWPQPLDTLSRLYQGYPEAAPPADFTVRLEPAAPWRRRLRPSVAIKGDYMLPGAAPLPLAQGLLAAELGMNLQMALGQKHFLLLHAATVEKDGRALVMTGESGAGKSTLAALLGETGWRLLGDEFALLELGTGHIFPFPRAISLKNQSIALLTERVAADRLGPLLEGTPKGTIRHLRPRPDAIARMAEPARPALILFPRYGLAEAVRPVAAAEVFVRLTQASTNYVDLGEAGFTALSALAGSVRACAIDYPDAAAAVRLAGTVWDEAAR